MGKSLVQDLVLPASSDVAEKLLHQALHGDEDKNVEIKLKTFGIQAPNGSVTVLVNACCSRNYSNNIVGVFFVGQNVTEENNVVMDEHYSKIKELTCMCQELKNPLSGICYSSSLLEMTALSDIQKQFLETSISCQSQMLKIIKDTNLQGIDDGSLALKKTEFPLCKVIKAVVSQAMVLVWERALTLIQNIPDEVKDISVFGDQQRIQQVLAGFLVKVVRYAASPNGWVEFHISLKNSDLVDVVTFQFRIICHGGEALPSELVEDIFHDSRWVTEEGLCLRTCRMLLKVMDGHVTYNREANSSYVDITMELPVCKKS